MALEKAVETTERVRPAVVLLTGAGASVALGVPTMKEFSSRFLDAKASGLTPREKRTYGWLTKELGVDNDLEMFLLAANSMLSSRETSLLRLIERTITRRPTEKARLEFRGRLSERLSDIEAVRDRALNFMADLCFQFNREKAVRMFRELVPALANRGYPVYTTNYDFALEHAADQLGVGLADNFARKGQRWLWDPRMQFETADALALVKLHGSATWYMDDDTGEIERLLNPTERNTAGKRVRRLAIFPTRFKDIYDQHFFSLYSLFLGALETATCLIVIGHSLRDEYLSAAIVHRLEKGGFSLIVVDPSFPDALRQGCKPAPQGRSGPVTHVPLRLEAFSEDLASLLRVCAPAELAAECAKLVRLSRKPKHSIRLRGKLERLTPGKQRILMIEVDAYVPADKRPARLVAWLGASQKVQDGSSSQEKRTVGPRFIAEDSLEAVSRAGVIQGAVDLKLSVPTVREWLTGGSSVTLHIGLLTGAAALPKDVRQANTLAVISKPVNYRV